MQAVQAEYWISAIRDHVVTLECLHERLSSAYAKGADALPSAITTPLKQTLVRSLSPQELSRVLRAAVVACGVLSPRAEPPRRPRPRGDNVTS
jgi:hypothetical protein